mmetsp:Transcript_9830/g.37038  ORF Transcript_9830/g.37038 Transcript_9830/m.37038 type:complete len:280 (-) Transcript_9830:2-841(-)
MVRGDVNDVEQKPGALDMPEKAVTHASVLGSASNQARNVRNGVGFSVSVYDCADVGVDGGEWVARDRRLRVAETLEQAALASVREAHEPDVRNALELQIQKGHAAARPGTLVIPQTLPPSPTRLDVIAQTASPTASHADGRVVGVEVTGLGVLLVEVSPVIRPQRHLPYHRTQGHFHHGGSTIAAMHLTRSSMVSILRFEVSGGNAQVIGLPVGHQEDVASDASIAPTRALASCAEIVEGDAPVSTSAALHAQADAIYEPVRISFAKVQKQRALHSADS